MDRGISDYVVMNFFIAEFTLAFSRGFKNSRGAVLRTNIEQLNWNYCSPELII